MTSDVIDMGCQVEQMQRDIALKNHTARSKKISDGICKDCGQAILPARLKANPYALRCIDCQADYELKEKQRGCTCLLT